MTLEQDAKEDMRAIINGEFGKECIYSTRAGVAQPAFNCLLSNSPMHGDEVRSTVTLEDIAITVMTDEIPVIKKRGFILVTGTKFEVVNIPVIDSEFSGTSVINLRTERTRQTKI